jgi:hypothetical protein
LRLYRDSIPTLLCCQGKRRHLAQASVEVAGERALDTAACLPRRLAGSEEPFVISGGLGVVADSGESDDMESPVELAVTAAVESVAALLATIRGSSSSASTSGGRGRRSRTPASGASAPFMMAFLDR